MCYSLTLLEPDHIQMHYAADFPAHWEFTPTYYTNAFTYPEYPILSNETPSDGSLKVDIKPVLSVTAFD